MTPDQLQPSSRRLLIAAQRATSHLPPSKRINTVLDLRKALGVSAQVANHWRSREVSPHQALLAERTWGCSASWILTGEEPPGWGQSDGPTMRSMGIDAALDVLGIALASIPVVIREALAINLSGWAREGGADHYRAAILGLLSSKRRTMAA